MKTLKITLIASALSTAASFWAARFGLIQRWWPEHPQLASFFICLVVCIAVQVLWPREWLSGGKN